MVRWYSVRLCESAPWLCMATIIFSSVAPGLGFGAGGGNPAVAQSSPAVDVDADNLRPGVSPRFNRDIRPILSDKCFACHGPDAPAKKIKLRLDSEAAALTVIVPGQPEQSKLIKRITHKDEAMRMPPADSGRTLTPREIELLSEWIQQGAKWQTHWAFIPPTRPALPEVRNKTWSKNPIDYFVLARLEKEGLHPAPEALRCIGRFSA